MAIRTGIQWCDSTNNPQMGCEGCELVKNQSKTRCYANQLVNRYAGLPGWPAAFNEPKIFMERVPKMIGWHDLTGTDRIDKPWLNDLPRIIFLNDMGDTFSAGMPKDWFKDVIDQIKNSRHQYLLLTKWPKMFIDFSKRHALPQNIWPGTSVTSNKTQFRINEIKQVHTDQIKWLSIEPLWSDITFKPGELDGISWVVIGGESGSNALPCKMEWIKHIIDQCAAAGVAVFVKQMGTVISKALNYTDGHGGDMNEWPEELRIRTMPKIIINQFADISNQ